MGLLPLWSSNRKRELIVNNYIMLHARHIPGYMTSEWEYVVTGSEKIIQEQLDKHSCRIPTHFLVYLRGDTIKVELSQEKKQPVKFYIKKGC